MDKEAIAKHNSFTMQSKMLRKVMERLYGPLKRFSQCLSMAVDKGTLALNMKQSRLSGEGK